MAPSAAKSLPPERLGAALIALGTWRNNRREPVSCPLCAAPGLEIEDRSARPHAEWYALSCAVCGLSHVLHIPLAAPAPMPD